MVLAAVGQICSTASMAHNLAQCRVLVQKAAAAGAKALFLPEASDYIASSPTESASLCKPASTSPFVQGLQAEARKHSLPIQVGLHEPSPVEGKIKNTLVWLDAQGSLTNRYQKLHLFDMDLSDTGGPKMRESDVIEAGPEILPPYDTELGKVGALICFDLRFAEVALALKRMGVQVLTYPSAFTPETGKMHWHALLRARAIETQAYVVAAAQVGAHNEKRSSYGHSLVVDPWGRVVAELGGVEEKEAKGSEWEPEIAVFDIDLDKCRKLAKEMPLLRRTDVYPEL